MGFLQSVASNIRNWFKSDNSVVSRETQKGNKRLPAASPYGAYGQTGMDALSGLLSIERDLMTRYVDYEEMDDYPEISAALDVYADDATVPDMFKDKAIWITSKDKVIEGILNDELLDGSLQIEEDIYPIVRTLAKYGSVYAELLVEESGVVGVTYLPTPTVRRVERDDGTLVGYVQDVNGRFGYSWKEVETIIAGNGKSKGQMEVFESWEVVHFRLRGKSLTSPHGHSILDAARWPFRRLVMAEDAALVHKLTKAPGRLAFYVDVGDLPPAQAMAYLNEVKKGYKKKKFMNSNGKMDFRRNPIAPDEDIFIPMRSGQESTRIETMSSADWQSTELLDYLRGKLFSAIKVPRAHLGLSGESSRASLAQEDVRFARTLLRLQREIKTGVRRICRVHLAAKGIDPDSVGFDVKMTIPSSLFELAQIELRNAQADNASRLSEFFTKEWILQNVFDFSESAASGVARDKRQEVRTDQRSEAEVQASIVRDYPELADQGGQPEGVSESSVDGSKRLGELMMSQEELREAIEFAIARLDVVKPIVQDIRKEVRKANSTRKVV
mgnify:CR=1 FL=1|tara:strand:- start:1660 stop:3327 length:1668 start_codon:yes stop_codon:yes gene_type:complete